MSDGLTLAFLGLHPDRLRDLRAFWGGDRALLTAIRRGRVDGVAADAVSPAAEQRDRLARAGAAAVFRGTAPYPAMLETIADPPEVLFVRGTLPPGPAVAVVGTRRCTGYGRSLARAVHRPVPRLLPLVSSQQVRGRLQGPVCRRD